MGHHGEHDELVPGSKGDGETTGVSVPNVPKVLGYWQLARGMVVGLFCIGFAVVVSALIYAGSHSVKGALIVLASFGGFGLLICAFQFVGIRQLARYKSPSFTHFQTSTATEYQVPYELKGAVVDSGETIGNWFGPVNLRGRAGITVQVLDREVDRQAVNTLLFTPQQVIGLMLGPDDLQNLQSGALKTVANRFVTIAGEGASRKGIQFETLNANHWVEMVDALSAMPLETALGNHLNFGLPYSKIQTVQVENHFVNPGFTFHLRDGRKLRYGSFKRSRLPEISNYLKQFVEVQ